MTTRANDTARVLHDLAATTGAGKMGYDKSLTYSAGTVGAQFNAQYSVGYVINQSGTASMAIVPTGFAQSVGVQSVVDNTASRLYVVPKGTPSPGTTAAIKVFATDYIADPVNYRDIGLYYDSTNAEFLINSKYNGTPGSPAPVYFSFQDGANIAGGFYRNGTYAGMVLGGRLPVGLTLFSSIPTLLTASAAFSNNTMLRWYDVAGTSAGYGFRLNASNTMEGLHSNVVRFSYTASLFSFALNVDVAGAISTTRVNGTAGDATPAVGSTSFIQIPTNGPTYNITDFTGSREGQRLIVLFSDNKPTVVNSSTLRLAGGANWTPTSGSTLSLVRGSSGWFETGRSVN